MDQGPGILGCHGTNRAPILADKGAESAGARCRSQKVQSIKNHQPPRNMAASISLFCLHIAAHIVPRLYRGEIETESSKKKLVSQLEQAGALETKVEETNRLTVQYLANGTIIVKEKEGKSPDLCNYDPGEDINFLNHQIFGLKVQLSQSNHKIADLEEENLHLIDHNNHLKEEICHLNYYATALKEDLCYLKKYNAALKEAVDAANKPEDISMAGLAILSGSDMKPRAYADVFLHAPTLTWTSTSTSEGTNDQLDGTEDSISMMSIGDSVAAPSPIGLKRYAPEDGFSQTNRCMCDEIDYPQAHYHAHQGVFEAHFQLEHTSGELTEVEQNKRKKIW